MNFPVTLLPALLLAGCAAMPTPSPAPTPAAYQQHAAQLAGITSFALNGRIAVLTEKKGFSGSLRWHHHEHGNDIGFYSPIGSQLGQMSTDADGVTLTTSDHKTYTAADAETLTQNALGWSLPMAGLSDWVLGRPGPGAAEILAWDSDGHIQHLRQSGWDIEYPLYMAAAGRQLPAKILMKSPRLDLKLVVEEWVGVGE